MDISPNLTKVLARLDWMEKSKIFPNGLRYLWTDAHGVCNYISLYKATNDPIYIEKTENLINSVYTVLGRPKGIRIGQEPDRDGQYFHYLTKWIFALTQFSKIKQEYHQKAVDLVKTIHPKFYIKNKGIYWKMLEDLSGPYPGYGYGGLDYYDGYCVYKLLDPVALSSEINDMRKLIDKNYPNFSCSQDLGLGEILWMSHFYKDEDWAKYVSQQAIETLDIMWVDKGEKGGYFCRNPGAEKVKFAFTNFGVSVGLQAANLWPDRVEKINKFFENYKSGDEYDTNSITHVMYCSSLFPGVFI